MSSSAASEASRGVLGRGAIYALGTAGPILANTLVTPALTRVFRDDVGEYGQILKALVVLQVVMMLASLGMPSVITRQGMLARGGVAGARDLLLRASFAGAGLAILAAVTSPLWHGLVGGTALVTALAVLGGGAFVAVENSQAMLRVLDRPGAFVTVSVLATLGGPVIGLASTLLWLRSAWVYVVGVAVGYALAGAVGLVLTGRGERRREPGDLRRALRMGTPLLPHMVALYCANGGMLFVASSLYDDAAAGRLGIALLLGVAPGVVTSALNNSWAPVVFAATPQDRVPVLERTTADIAMLTATVAGGVSVLSPWLLQAFADSRYQPLALVPAVGLAGIGTVLAIGYLANSHLLFVQGRTTALAIITPVSLAVGMTVAYLAGRLDLRAVALGFPATYACQWALVSLARHAGRADRWRQSVLAIPVLHGAAACLLGAWLPASGVTSFVRLPVAAGLGLVALWQVRRVVRR